LLTLGRLDEAESELAQLANTPRIEPYHELRAWLALRRGDFGLAIDEAEEAAAHGHRTVDAPFVECWTSRFSQIHAQCGPNARALEHLRAYRSLAAGFPATSPDMWRISSLH
jgi:hypothetical protein